MPSFILTASSCIISSLSSSSWSLYFSLIFFNLFWRDEKVRLKDQIMSDARPVFGSGPGDLVLVSNSQNRYCSYLLSSLQWLLGSFSSTFGPLVVCRSTSWNICLLLSFFLFLLLLLFSKGKKNHRIKLSFFFSCILLFYSSDLLCLAVMCFFPWESPSALNKRHL